MFKILGWGFGSVARVLDAASSTIDIVLAPSASSLKSQRTIAVAEHDTLSLGSRHDDRGGRVMSKEEILQSNGVGGNSSLRAGFKAARECFDNQPSLLDGYNNQAEQLRSTEFKRLGSKVYVDHAGATLYSEKQLEHAYKVHLLCASITSSHTKCSACSCGIGRTPHPTRSAQAQAPDSCV